MKTIYTDVSFLSTPLIEIGPKANEILALGWKWEQSFPQNWLARFSKEVDESVASADADAEIKTVMGDHWYEPPTLAAPITTQTPGPPRFGNDGPR